MSREPDFEKARAAVKAESERVEVIVEAVVAKYSRRNLIALIGISFMAGVWATTLQLQVLRLLKNDGDQETALESRKTEWTAWREGVNESIRRGMADHFSGADYNTSAYMFNMNSPNKLPYLWEIRREEGKP